MIIFAKLVKKFSTTIRRFPIVLAVALAACLFCTPPAYSQWDKDVFSWRGRQALADGKYAKAIENFNILTRLDTTDYWSFFYRGIAKYNLGDLRGAHRDFNTSVRLNPVFTNGYHYRAITESRFGNYDKALADLQEAISLRPGLEGLYFSRGVTYFLAQKFNDAVGDFDRYIRKVPDDPSAYLNRGASWLFLGDTLKAVSDYNKAIEIDRFEPEAYMRRGRVMAAQKKFDLAIEDLNKAIDIDPDNTFAYFNRALLHYERQDFNKAKEDFDRVLEDEPGNALTLYNRSLIYTQVGDYEHALDDIDRVININPGNVLAHFNRAAIYIETGRYEDAIDDYTKAIELYPDFAKAYLNRSYVERLVGRNRESKADYRTAQQKVREYKMKAEESGAELADTTRQFNTLLALDADFAKKDFNDELLQHRDIDIKLSPLYRFTLTAQKQLTNMALTEDWDNPLLKRFIASAPAAMKLDNTQDSGKASYVALHTDTAQGYFIRGLNELQYKQFNAALAWFDKAVKAAGTDESGDRYAALYKAFYLMNRGVLKAEMIDFIASLEGTVQTLSMDDQGATRARVSDQVSRNYDYSEAIDDMKMAAEILPDLPEIYFNLGNLECLSSNLVEAIRNYDRAIELKPSEGDAYYNRGLVLIYLKDKEKGCIDLSHAGQLGIADAYGVISKYCKEEGDR